MSKLNMVKKILQSNNILSNTNNSLKAIKIEEFLVNGKFFINYNANNKKIIENILLNILLKDTLHDCDVTIIKYILSNLNSNNIAELDTIRFIIDKLFIFKIENKRKDILNEIENLNITELTNYLNFFKTGSLSQSQVHGQQSQSQQFQSQVQGQQSQSQVQGQQSQQSQSQQFQGQCLIKSKGLINVGNSCYMSSVIQMLFSCNEYREFILNTQFSNDKLNALKEIFVKLNQTSSNISPIDYFNEYKILHTIVHMHQEGTSADPNEFLVEILNITPNKEIFKFCYISDLNNYIYILQLLVDKTLINKLNINNVNINELINLQHQIINSFINIPPENKYFIIQLPRTGVPVTNYLDYRLNFKENLIINNIIFYPIGIIIYVPGHYTYVTLCNGNIDWYYNDSTIDKNITENFIKTNSYIILYKRA